ncbi:hypothetical protein F0U63_33925 [Cystobacter fuscus]|nr:hypothetical protein F0U63_33925 [Cystobacter fuscus]
MPRDLSTPNTPKTAQPRPKTVPKDSFRHLVSTPFLDTLPQPTNCLTPFLLFTGLELLRRVASLVPPPRANLTRFHGVFAPGAQLRPFLVPQVGAEEASVAPQAAASKEPIKEKTPRGDWAEWLRRTFDFDVFACLRCGGGRRVLAYEKGEGGVRAILEHLGLPTASAHLARLGSTLAGGSLMSGVLSALGAARRRDHPAPGVGRLRRSAWCRPPPWGSPPGGKGPARWGA